MKMTAKDELVKFIINLTPEQANKIVKRMELLKQLAKSSDNELVFTETLLSRINGGKAV